VNVMTLAARNLTRNKTRVALTILGVSLAVLFFILIRTVLWSWEMGSEVAAKDRIATRHKVTFVMTLPVRYATDIREAFIGKGIKQTTFMSWFGAKDPKDEKNFFANFAVDHKTFLEVYDEVTVSPETKERWFNDPQGALVGRNLAKKMKVNVGDKVTLLGSIYPGNWEFRVAGIYTSKAKSFDESSFMFRWDYLNNSPNLAAVQKDQIGWMVSRTSDAARSAEMSRAVDKLFEDRDIQTLSQSERELNTSFLGMFSAILRVLNIGSMVIVLILMLILGNTIAMGVRERTYEYGVLRALGFRPQHIVSFIVGEAVLIGVVGGALGVLFGFGVVSGLSRWITENLGGLFPYFEINLASAVIAFGLGIVGGVIASVIPAYQASKLQVVNALRRVG
jgi:putative ABC transport system permease protein